MTQQQGQAYNIHTIDENPVILPLLNTHSLSRYRSDITLIYSVQTVALIPLAFLVRTPSGGHSEPIIISTKWLQVTQQMARKKELNSSADRSYSVYESEEVQNCLSVFCCKFDLSCPRGSEGTLLRSHTRSTPIRAPERCAMWLMLCNEQLPRKLAGIAVEA